jgi:prepilin-type N-terminal cleavage/methylation domain-containing protein
VTRDLTRAPRPLTRTPRRRSLAGNDGFTIIEVLVAATILLIGIVAVAGLYDLANTTTVKNRAREGGTNLARELVEAARGIPYSSLADATIEDTLQATHSSLADAEPTVPYELRRRGFLYTVTADVCVVDDARDGTRDPAAAAVAGYCADSPAAGTRDRNGNFDRAPEDYKRVAVRAQWTVRGSTRSVGQTTIVNNPGSAGAPAVLTLKANSGGVWTDAPVAFGPGSTSIPFQVNTNAVPAALTWTLDGVSQGLITTGANKTWTFTWNLGTQDTAGSVGDGAYLVGASAFDTYNVSGQGRTLTVIVNRLAPRTPTGFAGGRNGSVVELEWLPNSERDVIGYKVYRVDGTTETLVCDPGLKTSCVDENPPNTDGVVYRVKALDSDLSGQPREGSAASLTVVQNNQVPPTPDLPSYVLNADGTITIRWHRAGDDPDGDAIAFYRVYRDGQTVGDRYTRVDPAGDSLEFVDVTAGGANHTYYVTAVDEHFGESAFLTIDSTTP